MSSAVVVVGAPWGDEGKGKIVDWPCHRAGGAVRVADLEDSESLDWKIGRLLAHHNSLRRGLDLNEVDSAALKAELLEVAPKVLPYAQPVWRVLETQRRDSKKILFEGAQGMLL